MNHLHGVQKLFERRGPQNAIAGIEHRAFLFIRFHGVRYPLLPDRACKKLTMENVDHGRDHQTTAKFPLEQ